MDIQIEKVGEIYKENILSPIWKEGLPYLDERRINWSYEGNVCGKAQLWLLKDKATGEYFGSSALLPGYLFIKGKKTPYAIIVDNTVKKKYRTLVPALKLYKEIMKSSQDFALILAFPNKIAEAVLKMSGFKTLLDLVTNIKILKSRTVIEKKIRDPLVTRLLLPAATITDFGLRLFECRISGDKKYMGGHVDSFDERFDHIVEKAKNKFTLITDRNSNYLNWRYKDCPYKDYNFFVVTEASSSNIVGYIIYYSDGESVFVDDFLWLGESLKLEDLLSIFVKAMRKNDIKIIYFTLIENGVVEKAFKRMGFSKRNIVQTILYFSSDQFLNEKMPDLRERAFLTLGDQDI